ncbi:MAG: carotenoid biosynthesis protein [Nitrospinota bacterium]|nr:MAG: carotenoid biosynthesis protein [Nitrospinota bacterium]
MSVVSSRPMREFLWLLLSTIQLRWYVFFFLALALWASVHQLGGLRTALLFSWAYLVALLSELASTRIGFPYGFYYYIESTRGQEIWVSNVPFMDSLSYSFLAYTAYALALLIYSPLSRQGGNFQLVDTRSLRHSPAVGGLAVLFFVWIDIVVDPVALRGSRWFLGQIYGYPEEGIYFGVPLSNFLGWALVGAVIIGGFQQIDKRLLSPRWSRENPTRGYGTALWGPLLYYLILLFNIVVTFAIGEMLLGLVDLFIYLPVTAVILVQLFTPAKLATAEDLAAHARDFPCSTLARSGRK